jgi:CRISPR-associated protein Cas2
MLVVVSYDVNTEDKDGRNRLRKTAKLCESYGQRVQFSVFECLVDPAQWTLLKAKLMDIIDPEKDSLRFYFLGSNWERRVDHVGAKEPYNQQGPLVI